MDIWILAAVYVLWTGTILYFVWKGDKHVKEMKSLYRARDRMEELHIREIKLSHAKQYFMIMKASGVIISDDMEYDGITYTEVKE